MKFTCTNCGKSFEAKRHRQTCGDVCAKARQVASIDQMRLKRGEIYEKWIRATNLGMAQRVVRNRKKKRG